MFDRHALFIVATASNRVMHAVDSVLIPPAKH